MKVAAILCVRNEEACIATTLRHLIAEGLPVAVLDNGSTDSTWQIVSSFSKRDVIYHETLRYDGAFHLSKILAAGAVVAKQLGAEWILAQAADEILQSPYLGETLRESLAHVEAEGANAVNFHEFNFLPTDPTEDYRGRDFRREMTHYYFFQPRRHGFWRIYPRQMRLFRLPLADAFAAGAGHVIRGVDVKCHRVDFVLRHYPALSFRSFVEKYQGRRYAPAELARGWHLNRSGIDFADVTLPPPAALRKLDRWDSNQLDVSDPWPRHFWQYRDGRPKKWSPKRILSILGL